MRRQRSVWLFVVGKLRLCLYVLAIVPFTCRFVRMRSCACVTASGNPSHPTLFPILLFYTPAVRHHVTDSLDTLLRHFSAP